MEYVSLYLQDSKVGSGRRNFIVLKRGRKKATLLYVPTVTKVIVPIEELDNAIVRDVSWPKMKSILAMNADGRHRNFCSWSRSAVRELCGDKTVAKIERKYAPAHKAKEAEAKAHREELTRYGG